jgi:hypothetical protein
MPAHPCSGLNAKVLHPCNSNVYAYSCLPNVLYLSESHKEEKSNFSRKVFLLIY